MEFDPIVSVVIPAYNAQAFLSTAVESVLRQTLVNHEIIIIDDGSSDGTWMLMQKWSVRDARVRTLQLPTNQGPSAARNAGIATARGEWVAILDADDYFLPRRLETLVSQGEKLSAGLVADNLLLMNFESGGLIGQAFPPDWPCMTTPLTLTKLIFWDTPWQYSLLPIGYMKPIVRRSLIRSSGVLYCVEHKIGEDFLFYFHLILSGAAAYLVDSAEYVSRVRPLSLSRGNSSSHIELYRVNLRALADTPVNETLVRRALIRRKHALGFELIRHYFNQRSFWSMMNAFSLTDIRYIAERASRAIARRLRRLFR